MLVDGVFKDLQVQQQRLKKQIKDKTKIKVKVDQLWFAPL